MVKKCLFLSMYDLKELGFESDDSLVIPYLKKCGWETDILPWNKPDIIWNEYKTVVIRSTWDYQHHAQKFLSVLGNITTAKIGLANPLDIVNWNLNKNYLLDLQSKGVLIPPTIKGKVINEKIIGQYFDKLKSDELIIKPIIGANADKNFRIQNDNHYSNLGKINGEYKGAEYLVQPFRRNILNEGEYSLIFFNNRLSHSIVKVPQNGDYRVQEEHGGKIIGIKPTKGLIEAGKNVLKALDRKLLYARVDLIRNEDYKYELMELELIEPSLYFRTNRRAAYNFAEAFIEWYWN